MPYTNPTTIGISQQGKATLEEFRRQTNMSWEEFLLVLLEYGHEKFIQIQSNV